MTIQISYPYTSDSNYLLRRLSQSWIIPEEASEVIKPAVAEESQGVNMPTARGPGICEYDLRLV